MSSPGQIQTRAKDPSNPAPSPSTKSGPNHDQDPSNFKKDDLGNTVLKGSLKDQLNEKAREEWIREVKERQGVDEKKSVVDKGGLSISLFRGEKAIHRHPFSRLTMKSIKTTEKKAH